MVITTVQNVNAGNYFEPPLSMWFARPDILLSNDDELILILLKSIGPERDSNPRHLRFRCSALPTELSKPHESGHMRVSPLHVDVILGPSIVKNES